MPTQVFVRKKSLGRDMELVLAEVLAVKQGGEVLRVKLPDSKTPVEVKAAETLPVGVVEPGQAWIARTQRPPEKVYSTARGALARQIY